jgi:hypothetical protein
MERMTINKAIAAAALAAALAVPAGSAEAQTVPNLFQKILGVSNDEPAINYSERAPLVIPPKRDLPAPGGVQAAGEDPNWPKDPDENKRRKQAASPDSRGPASNNTELLTRDELALGTRDATEQRSNYETERESKTMSNPVNPKVLAHRGGFGAPEEPLDPSVCPQRRSLVDPPGCINKPLASAPLKGDEPLPSEADAEANKPWYQKIWGFGGGSGNH